ncbi:hypothetical protein COGO111599_05265 [Corynebacterium gottingense]
MGYDRMLMLTSVSNEKIIGVISYKSVDGFLPVRS